MARRAIPTDAPAWLPLALAMAEKTLQENVRRCALLHGWLFFHAHDSRHSPAGFPDIVAIRHRTLLAVELKREGKEASAAQREWLAAFKRLGARAYVWTPADWFRGDVEAEFRDADD